MAHSILDLKANNPHFWNCRLEASKYSEAEITETLEAIEVVNAEWDAFTSKVYDDILTWDDEYGTEPMNSRNGYASDTHQKIAEMIHNGSPIPTHDNYNGQYDWPVRKWQKEIKQLRSYIKKIEKEVSKL